MTVIGTAGSNLPVETGKEIGRTQNLKEAQDLAAKRQGSEAISFDKKTGQYVVEALTNDNLSVQELRKATVEPNVVAFSVDSKKPLAEETLVVKSGALDSFSGSCKDELRESIKGLNPDLNENAVNTVLQRQMDKMTDKLNDLSPQGQEHILTFLANTTPENKAGILKLFLMDNSAIKAMGSGDLFKKDHQGVMILQQMIKIANSPLPPGLTQAHNGNEVKAKKVLIGNMLEVTRGELDVKQSKNNCGLSSMHHVLVKHDPARYINYATQLILNGQTTLAEGSPLKLPQHAFYKGYSGLPQIMEGALGNLAKGGNYDFKSDENVGIGGKDIPKLMSKLMPGHAYETIGDNYAEHIVEVYGAKGNDQKAYDALIKAKQAGKMPAFAGVIFGDFQKAAGNPTQNSILNAFHVIVIEDIDVSKEPPVFTIKDPNQAGMLELDGNELLPAMTWASVPK